MKTDGERGGEPRRIAEVMASLMASRGYGRVQATRQLQDAWQEVSGLWADHTRPGACRRGVLEVVVANSVVLQELNFRTAELVGRLKTLIPEQKITNLRFRLGHIESIKPLSPASGEE
jgi:predicted nucleic acid-binding Zn ribbon protein